MNWDQIKGRWKDFKGQIRQRWGKLTDDDLERIKGHRESLKGKLQERYGYEKDKAEQEIDGWLKRMN